MRLCDSTATVKLFFWGICERRSSAVGHVPTFIFLRGVLRRVGVDVSLFFLKEWGDNPAVHLPVHEKHCGPCPASCGHDPETEDFIALPIELRRLTTFACAWRTEGQCRGYVDLMGLEST